MLGEEKAWQGSRGGSAGVKPQAFYRTARAGKYLKTNEGARMWEMGGAGERWWVGRHE